MLDMGLSAQAADFGCGQEQEIAAPKVLTYQLGKGFASEEVPVCHEYVNEEILAQRAWEEKQRAQQEAQREAARIRAEQQRREDEQEALRQAKLAEARREAMLIAAQRQRMENERKNLAAQKEAEIARFKKEQEERRLKQLAEMKREEELQRALQKEAEAERIRLATEKAAELERQKIENEKALQEHRAQLLAQEEVRREQERIAWAQEEARRQLAAENRRKQEGLSKKTKITAAKNLFDFKFADFWSASRFAFGFDFRRAGFSFALAAAFLALGIGGVSFAQKGLALRGKVLGVSQDGYQNLSAAAVSLASQNFTSSAKEFALAYDNFSQASDDLDSLGSILVDGSRYLPYVSKLSAGKNVAEAGKHISGAGKALNDVVAAMAKLKNPLDQSARSGLSLLDVFSDAGGKVANAKQELVLAKESIDKVNVADLPPEKQAKFLLLKEKLPLILSTFDDFLNNTVIMADLLGGNGPRKYLFLFQNNTEMRATGGFIGSYGLLDISQGHVRNFFVDGIFNPDGQLKAKIIPPGPIQKISAAWSLHDSNWFPDFPASAREAINFYEKTGGPTVDGVITLTPTVMEKLLAITGPIEMPDYDVTLTADNFVEKTQYEVEVDYDRQENKPKKILSDLAPLVLERIVNSKDMGVLVGAAKVLSDGLKEKHILLYSENQELEKKIAEQGWSGEVLSAQKDYLSVINTNINGFKTDAVVKEKISHQSEIREDGSIVDTVSVTRTHEGGNTDYEWWNKVNANYMRVYVPRGAQLIEVSGQTREADKAPLDYAALGFKKDPQVEKEEATMRIDEKSGTRIYEDADKTVFANWTYVSPGETMTITYKYLLPFKLFQLAFGSDDNADSYSLVAQKQAGSKGSEFSSSVSFPAAYQPRWTYPQSIELQGDGLNFSQQLSSDQFLGVVFEKQP